MIIREIQVLPEMEYKGRRSQKVLKATTTAHIWNKKRTFAIDKKCKLCVQLA